ncbi:MAG: MFS transporter [Eggerthellaceae bacterium]|nr:MFS transporter [Eggerthellaceae bacterium]
MNARFETQRLIQLIFGFVMMLFTGVSYAWSLFAGPLQQDMAWTADETSLVFTISILMLCAGSLIGGLLDKRLGSRTTFFAGAACIATGLVGCSFASEIWQMYIFYGMFAGFAIGLFYNNIITTVGSWYPNRVGFVSGLMLMGYGMGALVLGPILSVLISSFGWRTAFVALGLAFAAFGVLAALVVRRSPVERGEDTETIAADVEQLSPAGVVRRANFWVFVLWAICMGGVGVGIIGHASTIATALKAAPAAVVLATGLMSLANGVARPVWGAFYDRFRIEGVEVAVTVVLALGLAVVEAALVSQSVALLLVAALVVGAGYGGVSPGIAAFVRTKFGLVNYKQNFGLAICCIGPYAFGAYILGVLLVTFGSYVAAVPYLFIILVAGAVLLVPANLMARRST